MEKDIEIFEGKTFSSLVRDIYTNSSHKKDQINQLIKDLHGMIKDVGGATVVAPMIKDYLDVAIKNDDQLVKLSAVLQRVINGGSAAAEETGEFGLSEAEKEQLLENVKDELSEMKQNNNVLDAEMDKIAKTPESDGA
jgi:hypothetical protein